MHLRAIPTLTSISAILAGYIAFDAFRDNHKPTIAYDQQARVVDAGRHDDRDRSQVQSLPFEAATAKLERTRLQPALEAPAESEAADYVPTKRESRILRKLRNYCRELSIHVTGAPRSLEQWGQFRAVMAQLTPKLQSRLDNRAKAASQIALERLHNGQLERIASGNDRAAKRAVRQAMSPQHARQIVSIVSSAGNTYVSRLDPGQDSNVDDLSDEIMATKRLLHEAASHFLR